tara:strand:- start:480 stop:1517 length:1038 start_codon:yes stop_codon:yes gene_type:complete
MKKLNNNLKFSYNKAPLIIAEISGNHNGYKSRFLKLVESACKNGADLIKIQSYELNDITLDKKTSAYLIKSGIWKGKYLSDLYQKACTPFSWHADAFKIAKRYKKIIFSSPFSERAVDFLEKLKVPIYKIASFEITDHNLINYIASKRKTVIISTGMATIKEIKNAIKIINKYHKKIVILHCVSNYPTKISETNLKRISLLKKEFKNYPVGLSDHTNNIYSSLASIPLGVVAIEKHFNIDNKKTPDSDFSINPENLKKLKEISREIFVSSNNLKNFEISKKNLVLRRSIYSKSNIKKNDKILKKNIISLRPLIGVKSEDFFKIIGKKAKRNITKNSPIFFKDLKN